MSHSKRNTSLAFFTNHERSELKAHWGTQATRLTRDSFLPFASCRLCLQSASDPVACPTEGHLFCRECALNNLLAQGKEIKRLEKDESRRKEEDTERARDRAEEEHIKTVEEFERTLRGEEGEGRRREAVEALRMEVREEHEKQGRGTKRKFELDEDEMLKNAIEERTKARKNLDAEKALKQPLPSFWIPSQTPSIDAFATNKSTKLKPTCPSSNLQSAHHLSLKTMISVNFTTSTEKSLGASNGGTNSLVKICPACKRTLSNSLKAMLAVPCGHVICAPCAKQFMSTPSSVVVEEHGDNTGNKGDEAKMLCFVCEADLTGGVHGIQEKHGANGKEVKKKKKDKDTIKAGLVELATDGTGFAGGGKNMARKEGVAFQC